MNETLYQLGPIMKAARKFKKFNQADVASAIGCSQSALSKMEHNLLVPSAPQWFLFSRFTAIPPEALETGIIDRHTTIKFNSTDVSQGFKLPKRYRLFRSLKMRELYPFMKVLKQENPQWHQEFIAESGLDPEFFLDFDNLVNFNALIDVVGVFLRRGKHSEEVVKKVVAEGQDKIYWDHFYVDWQKLSSVEEVMKAFSEKQAFFQIDFQLKVEGKGESVQITYLPEQHLKQMGATASPDVHHFLNLYRKATIEHVIRMALGKRVEVTLLTEADTAPFEGRFQVKAA